jgi:hypothetical protein
VAVRYSILALSLAGESEGGSAGAYILKHPLPEGGRDIGICPLGRGEYKKGKDREKVGKCIEKKEESGKKKRKCDVKGLNKCKTGNN